MYYIAEPSAPGAPAEFFDGAALGENRASAGMFADNPGSQVFIVLRLLLSGGIKDIGDWRNARITVSGTPPDSNFTGIDITKNLVTWAESKPGNPMRFRDSLTGWMPSAEGAQMLDGLEKVTGLHDLAVCLGRVHGGQDLAAFAARLSERAGMPVKSLRIENPETAVEPILAAECAHGTVRVEFPFLFPALCKKLLAVANPELAWATDDSEETLI